MLGILILTLFAAIGVYLIMLGREVFFVPEFASGKRWVRLLGVFVLFLVIDCSIIWVGSGEKTLGQALTNVKRVALVHGAAVVISKKLGLPADVGGGVNLVNVSAEDRRLIYSYVADGVEAQVIDQVWANLHAQVTAIACERADYALLLKNGLFVEHRITRSGIDVAPVFRLEPYMCQTQQQPLQ